MHGSVLISPLSYNYINSEWWTDVINEQGYIDNGTLKIVGFFFKQEMDLGRGLERVMKLAVSYKPVVSSYSVK